MKSRSNLGSWSFHPETRTVTKEKIMHNSARSFPGQNIVVKLIARDILLNPDPWIFFANIKLREFRKFQIERIMYLLSFSLSKVIVVDSE